MEQAPVRSPLLQGLTLRVTRLPLFYLFIGILFVTSSYIDNIFPLPDWKNSFDALDKIGDIFIALAFVTFLYHFFIFLCLQYEKNLTANKKITSLILSSLRKGLRIIFILIAINIAITIIGPTKFHLVFADSMISTLFIIAIGWMATQILYTAESVMYQYMMTLTLKDHLRVKALYTKMHIIRNIGTVVIVIITIAAILMSFNSVRNIGISMLASAGFLTAIIGLSAQKTLSSLSSGLQIALSQPIKIGDIVVIEGESGIIEEINFTCVKLKLGDRRRLVVPISYFTERPFENWSHDGGSLRSSLHLRLNYMASVEPLRAALDHILMQSSYWDKVAKKLQVYDMDEHGLDIRIQVSAASADDLADLRIEVREKMLEFIRTHHPEYFLK